MVEKIPRRSKHSAAPAKPASRAEERAPAKKAVAEAPQESAAQKQSFLIVGVGASAGGLEAFTAFLKHLPPDSGMAFVLIQHLDPKQHSQLTDLLSKASRMPVLEVNADTAVKANHVYVISPGVSLSMSNGRLRAEPREPGRNLPIDHFLRSLAHDKSSNAIGIVLSGTASDGTLGLKAVKAEGGVTFAQEPSSAQFGYDLAAMYLPPKERMSLEVTDPGGEALVTSNGACGSSAGGVETKGKTVPFGIFLDRSPAPYGRVDGVLSLGVPLTSSPPAVGDHSPLPPCRVKFLSEHPAKP